MPVDVVFMAWGCAFGFTSFDDNHGSVFDSLVGELVRGNEKVDVRMCGIDSEMVVNLMWLPHGLNFRSVTVNILRL